MSALGKGFGIKRYPTELDYLRALEKAVFQVVPRECGCCDSPPLDEALANLSAAHASVWGPECDHLPLEPSVPSTRPDLYDDAQAPLVAEGLREAAALIRETIANEEATQERLERMNEVRCPFADHAIKRLKQALGRVESRIAEMPRKPEDFPMMPTLALSNVTLFLRLCEELKVKLSPTLDGPYPNVALMFEKSRARVMLSFPYLHGDTRQFATFLLDDTDTIDGVEGFIRETVARLRELAVVDQEACGG